MSATLTRVAIFATFAIDAVEGRNRGHATTTVHAMPTDDRDEGAEPLLSSGDVARRLGVQTGTINAWVRQGRLVPTVTTMGGRYRWRWSDVERQMREQRG